jgi:hypothetical protein
MTLLSICQNVADEVGVDQPASVIGNGEDTAKRLLAAAKREGKELARKSWTVLQVEHPFTTVASTAEYSLPADYSKLISDTVWDRTNYWKVRGGLSPAQWQVRKSAILAQSDIRRAFRIKASSGVRKFFLDPVPSSADDLVFEYLSTSWCEDSGGTGQSQWAADTDVGRLDENLIELGVRWRFLQRLGLSYLDEKDEYERAVDQEFAADYGPELLNMAEQTEGFFVNVPETGFG